MAMQGVPNWQSLESFLLQKDNRHRLIPHNLSGVVAQGYWGHVGTSALVLILHPRLVGQIRETFEYAQMDLYSRQNNASFGSPWQVGCLGLTICYTLFLLYLLLNPGCLAYGHIRHVSKYTLVAFRDEFPEYCLLWYVECTWCALWCYLNIFVNI